MDRDYVVLCNPIFGVEAHLNNERQDPVFFEGSSHWVLHISYGEYWVRVYCDGDTRASLSTLSTGVGDKPYFDIGLVCTDDFIKAGLDTDKKLYEASEKNLLEWVNNPWFDMYGCEGDHLDCVTDSISEAIESAKYYLMDRAESADIIMGVNDDLTLTAL